MNRLTTLFSRAWAAYRRHRWESAQIRDQLRDDRSAAHLDRQRAGIRDVQMPPMGGGGF